MKLYTYYTDSHKYLYDNFLKKTVDIHQEYQLIAGIGIQHCVGGGFLTENFGKTCFEKVKFIIDSNEWESNDVIMFCDADTIFLNKTKEVFLNELGEFDMIFQNDSYTCNTGIYICRKNNRVRELLEHIFLIKDGFHNEQVALNHIIGSHPVKYKLFDYKVWNVKYQGLDPWDGNANINFPHDILMFHANYMVGIDKKINSLNLAFNKFYKK